MARRFRFLWVGVGMGRTAKMPGQRKGLFFSRLPYLSAENRKSFRMEKNFHKISNFFRKKRRKYLKLPPGMIQYRANSMLFLIGCSLEMFFWSARLGDWKGFLEITGALRREFAVRA
ncbi:MAG: hypothetical protein Q4D98_11965 [Planctomycetia bacterium]|nr:hypothetical protein [Planctomycetia bacterium]